VLYQEKGREKKAERNGRKRRLKGKTEEVNETLELRRSVKMKRIMKLERRRRRSGGERKDQYAEPRAC
jgi:hypothetical protein